MRLIDADALTALINNSVFTADMTTTLAVNMAARWIENAPTIESGQKKGRWIFYELENDRYDDMRCPFCKKSYTVDAYRIDDIGFTAGDLKFCPNCGARLTEDEG